MRIRIDFTVEVPRENLPDLYEFMQTTREGVGASLIDEAKQYLYDYLDGGGIPVTVVREAWL